MLGADAGYVRNHTLTVVSSYRGTFRGVNYGFRLHHGIAVSYSYRGYVTDTGKLVITETLRNFQSPGRITRARYFKRQVIEES